MSERMTEERLAQWENQTPEDVWREVRRARREEAQQEDRIHALEVQQAELLRQTKEQVETIKALAEALREARDAIPSGLIGASVKIRASVALRKAGTL